MAAASASLARKLDLLLHPNLSHSLAVVSLTISELKPIHSYTITSGLSTNPFVVARLIAFCAISSSGDLLHYANSLFSSLLHPTLFTYNSMIRGFSQSPDPIQSIHLYTRMLRSRVTPDNFTFPFVLRSCSALQLADLGRGVHGHVAKLGLDSNVFIVNNAITMYSGCGNMSSARQMFDEKFGVVDVVSWTAMITGYSNCVELDRARWFFDRMPSRNLVSWNAMLTGYAKSGLASEAYQLFDKMPERNLMSWSSLVSGFAQCGLCEDALNVFGEMLKQGLKPKEATFVSAVSACAQLRDLVRGELVHRHVLEHELVPGVILDTALVDMYGKCGSIGDALSVFKQMPIKNIYSWNSMITGLALNGSGKQALTLYWKMRLTGLEPNAITFTGVLSACSHTGLVDEGERFFDMMTRVCRIRPLEEHYGCMVDLLGRAGLLKEALEFVIDMPVEPHPELWGALAGACSIHSNAKLGEEVGKRLIELEPHRSGRYVLLCNIYATARKWDDMETVRRLLKERKVAKIPGNSAVELKTMQSFC